MRNHLPLPSPAWNKINQGRLSLRFCGLISLYALFLCGAQNAEAEVLTWNNDATGNRKWETTTNWTGGTLSANDDLNFNGTARLASDNDSVAGTIYNSLTFGSGAGNFILDGNQITLGGNITNNATVAQLILLDLALNGNRQFDSAGSSSVLRVNGIISGGFGLEKTGLGTLTLGGANTYTGSTTITAGTLLMGGSNVLSNSSAVVMAGGTLSAPASGINTDTTGALSMTANSIIDMGAGTNSLTFASLGSLTGTLSIWNWTGAANTVGGTDQLNFSTGTANDTYSNISFYSGAGSGLIGTGRMLADGGAFELVPVPEPGALFAGLALMAPLAWRERRHWMRCREARPC